MTSVARVVEAARAAGVEAAVREFPEGTRTAEAAAAAVGCDVAQIVKTLVFVVDGSPVIAMVSGRHRLDPAKLAVATGGAEARRASPEEARDATGFAIGGTPPFGHARRLPMVLDRTLLDHPEVWCAAGTPRAVFPIDPSVLLAATGAVAADLAEE
jgi:Cys-tRNA(Pro) deacylase